MVAAGIGGLAGEVQALHFKPADHVLGDVHPYFRDGECFLYYLKPGEFRSSLALSRDLLRWEKLSWSTPGFAFLMPLVRPEVNSKQISPRPGQFPSSSSLRLT